MMTRPSLLQSFRHARRSGSKYCGSTYDDRYTLGGGFLSSVATPAGSKTSYAYDYAAQVTGVTDAAGNTTSYRYDAAGRTTAAVLPDNSSHTASYNKAGRVTAVRELDASGTVLATSRATYDANGNPLSMTDARGTTRKFSYDAANRVAGETQPVTATESITTGYGYDAAGNRTRFTDGRGNAFVTTYNPWNLPESQIEPATPAYPDLADRTFTTTYDANGRVASRLAPGGVRVTHTYDAAGNLTGQTGTGADAPTTDRSFGYDPAGRLTSASAPGGTDRFGYDDRGFLLEASGPSGESSFTYNPDGLMASRTDAAGTSSYRYDPAGRLAGLTDAATGTELSYSYNALSEPKTITYGGSDVRNFGYDARHRLASDVLKTSQGATVASISYGYDANGDLTSKTTSGFSGSAASTNTYTYDLARRLTSWDNGATRVGYAYDASGNRTSVGGQDYTYDARNELIAGAGVSYRYTPRGTLAATVTGTQTVTSTSDAFDQMIIEGGRRYAYDALERVVSVAGGGTTTELAYSGTGNLVASDGAARYSRDPSDALVGVRADNSSSGVLALTDLHTDLVGQFRADSNALTGSATYDPLGNVTAASGWDGSVGYQSGWTDPDTGRVNMAARWYDPETGQFSTRDSYTLDPVADPISANRYAYANGNPLTNTDPTGHLVCVGPPTSLVEAGVCMVARASAIEAAGAVAGPQGTAAVTGVMFFIGVAGYIFSGSGTVRHIKPVNRGEPRSGNPYGPDNPSNPYKGQRAPNNKQPRGGSKGHGGGGGVYRGHGNGHHGGGDYVRAPTNRPPTHTASDDNPGRPAPATKPAPGRITVRLSSDQPNDAGSQSVGTYVDVPPAQRLLTPTQVQLKDACATGGILHWDGSRSTMIWRCGDGGTPADASTGTAESLLSGTPGSVTVNALEPHEIRQARSIVDFRGGSFVGNQAKSAPGIDVRV